MKDSYVELVDLLKKHELTISTCESITGGMIASMIVEVSGASKVFKGGLVVYTNEAKQKLANISEKTLNEYGAISKQCVIEMANNTNKKLSSDISIAVSGNAGPVVDENKPVGMSYLAISIIDKTYWYEIHTKSTSRNDIRIETTAICLEKTIKLIKDSIR